MVEVDLLLKGGHRHNFFLEAGSPFLNRLKFIVGRRQSQETETAGELIQLPVDGGKSGLTFAARDLVNVAFIR